MKVRDRVSPSLRAVTVNDGVVVQMSCSMYGPFGAREVLPLVFELDGGVDVGHFLGLHRDVDDLLDVGLLLFLSDLRRVLLHRSRPVLRIRRNGREPDVHAFRDRARLRHFGRQARDPSNLVLRHDRAAGKTPDSAVNDADAEPRGSAVPAPDIAAAEAPEAATAPPAAASSATCPPPAPAEPAAEVGEITIAAGGVDAVVRIASEPDVGIRAPAARRFLEGHVGETLELRLEHAPGRRLREEIGHQVACRQRDARRGHRLHEIPALHGAPYWKLSPRRATFRVQRSTFGTTCDAPRATAGASVRRTCRVANARGTSHRTWYVARRTER